MKKLQGIIFVISLIFINGCSTQPKFEKISECIIDNETAPNWVCGVKELPGLITEVGSSQSRGASNAFIRKAALASARGNLINRIEADVKSSVKNSETVSSLDKVVYKGEQQTIVDSNQILKKSFQIAYWQQSKTKEVFVLIGIKRSFNVK